MIIRLIDIVLTLLFGFICIATLDVTGRIQLPCAPNADLPVQVGVAVVSVDPAGTIHVGNDGNSITGERFERVLGNQLKQESLEKKSAGEGSPKLSVKVQVDRDCPAVALRNVVKICNRLGIRCSIEVKKKALEERKGAA